MGSGLVPIEYGETCSGLGYREMTEGECENMYIYDMNASGYTTFPSFGGFTVGSFVGESGCLNLATSSTLEYITSTTEEPCAVDGNCYCVDE